MTPEERWMMLFVKQNYLINRYQQLIFSSYQRPGHWEVFVDKDGQITDVVSDIIVAREAIEEEIEDIGKEMERLEAIM